ncbi:MAG TPA: PAS domain S-box protein [Clostridia bacterium]|nr:PAS domain S-box protein [Clostridia bacterium]
MDYKFYKDLVMNSPNGYALHKIVLDKSGKPIDYIFLEINKAYEKYTGLVASSVINRKVSDVIPNINDFKVDWISEYGSIAMGGAPREFIHYSKTVDKYYRINVFSMEDGLFVTHLSEIRESQELEYRLHYEKELMQKYLDTANIMFININRHGIIESINKKGCEILAGSENKIVGLNWFETFIPESVRKDVIGVFNKVVRNEVENVAFYENNIVTLNGDVKYIAWHNTIIRDEKGSVISILSAGNDISRRKKTEKDLYESRALLEAAFDNSQAGIAIADAPNGKLRYINKAGLRIIGRNEDDLIKDIDFTNYTGNWKILRIDGTPYEQNGTPLERAVLLGEYCSDEFIIRRDNETRYVLNNAAPVRDPNGIITAGIIIFLDITERRNLEKARLELEAQLRNQQKLESIGTLASGVAHEINNPINGIMNYGQLILDARLENNEIDEYAREIISESNRVATIVKNLLDFSRQHKQEHSYADIKDIIERTASLTKTVFRHDQIKLNLLIDDNLPRIKCRSQQIQQVIMNLITNSRDALNEAYPGYDDNKIINLYCSSQKKDKRNWLKITVEDFGKGIPDEVIDNIFDPFFTTKGRDHGTGLGLSISYGIIRDHHGEIHVETKEGQYTRFILDLPCDNGWNID